MVDGPNRAIDRFSNTYSSAAASASLATFVFIVKNGRFCATRTINVGEPGNNCLLRLSRW